MALFDVCHKINRGAIRGTRSDLVIDNGRARVRWNSTKLSNLPVNLGLLSDALTHSALMQLRHRTNHGLHSRAALMATKHDVLSALFRDGLLKLPLSLTPTESSRAPFDCHGPETGLMMRGLMYGARTSGSQRFGPIKSESIEVNLVEREAHIQNGLCGGQAIPSGANWLSMVSASSLSRPTKHCASTVFG